MSDMIIRQAEEKDVKQIAHLDTLCFAVPWSELSFRQEITENERAIYIVAKVEENIVGYAGMWVILDEGHITNVAVHPDYRRKHIGQALVSILLSAGEECGVERTTLEVRESNEAAINLYKSFDFKPEGLRKGYYEDNNENAVIMWRGGFSENV